MLPDFQYVLAHPDILTELPAIRGLLRKRYPNLQNGQLFNCGKKCETKLQNINFIAGSLTLDLVNMVKHYRKGIKYSMVVDPYDESLGIVEMKIGQVKHYIFFIVTMYFALELLLEISTY